MKRWIVLLVILVPASALGQMPEVQDAIEIALTDAQPQAEAKFSLPIADLVRDTEFPGIHGLLDVRIATHAHGDRISRIVELNCEKLWWKNTLLGKLSARIITPSVDGRSSVEVSMEGALINLQASLRAKLRVDFVQRSLALEPGELEGSLTLSLPDLLPLQSRLGWAATQGAVKLDVEVSGSTEAPVVRGGATVEDLYLRYDPLGSGFFRWEYAAGMSELEGELTEGHVKWLSGSAKIPVDLDILKRTVSWRESEALDANLRIANLTEKRLRPWLQVPPQVRFTLDGNARVHGTLADLQADTKLAGTLLSNSYSRPLDIESSSTATLQKTRLNLGNDLQIELQTGMSFQKWRSGQAQADDTSIAGTLKAELPLQALEPLLPAIGASQGTLFADLTLSGDLAGPLLNGNMKTSEAEFTLVNLNRRLTQVDVSTSFQGDAVDFEFEMLSLPGFIKGKGSSAFSPKEVNGSTSVIFEDLPIVRADFPVALATGAGDVTWLSSDAETNVDVVLGKSQVQLSKEALPPINQLPSNANVHFLNRFGRIGESLFAGSGILNFSMDVSAGIKVSGESTDVLISEGFKLRRVGDMVTTEGGLSAAVGSTFSLFNNPMQVRAGLVTIAPGNLKRSAPVRSDGFKFAVPLEPVIEMVAQGEVDGTLVMVKLNGPLQRPNLTMLSFPLLPEYQIISLLVTGRADSMDERNGNVRRAASKLVERYHNPSLERQLFDQIGVDKVGFGFGSSVANPILTVGKQLSRDLYIETVYRHDAPPDENMMEARVEQRIGNSWTVDTTLGEAAEGRAGVFWATSWGAPPTKPPSAEVWSIKNPSHSTEDDDQDGVFNPFDLCSHEAEDMDGFEDEDGCNDADNDGDGIPDVSDIAPLEPETYNGVDDDDGAPDESPTRLQGFAGTARTYYFERRSARLPKKAREELSAFAEVTTAFRAARILVVGHSDSKGSDQRNLIVSKQRGMAMRAELIRAGVASNRIEVEGRGATEPLIEGDTPEAHEANRRVEVRLFYVDAPTTPAP